MLTTSAFSRLVRTAGEIIDEDVPDPLGNMFIYLQEKRDQALAKEWGLWLIDGTRSVR